MVRVKGDIIINRSVEDVFDFVADERNRYDPRIRRAEKLTDGPIGVGTRFRSESTSMGRTVEMEIEITEYERPRRLGSSTHMSSMEIHSTLVFEAVPGGTRMRWASDLHPRGLLRVARPLVGWIGRRQARDIWAGLKRVLEG
jgi:Polyketide cyclase / dehydrase and lipid transport